MPTEDDLRSALSSGVAGIHPDVDRELDRVLSRAVVRDRTRRASYAVGVAAVAALVLLLLGRDWRPQADDAPRPATPVQVRDLPSGVGRYENPADLTPGRYDVDFLPDYWPRRVEVDVDVPEGWGQDDRFALATGPAGEPATRRLDFIAGAELSLHWCAGASLPRDRTTLDVAQAIGSVAAMSASPPRRVTVDGHDGYLVELRDAPTEEEPACAEVGSTFLYSVPGILAEARGFTTLVWVLAVDGQEVAVFASYGPGTTPDQVDELVRMVETSHITIR